MYFGPFITGRGLVTALGDSLQSTWDRLLAGDSIGTHSPARLERDAAVPRVTQLALHAAREAIDEARWGDDLLRDPHTALVIGTSRGPINEWLTEPAPSSPIGLHQVSEMVAGEFKMGWGPRLTYSAACASSLHALCRAALMLRSGEADRALVIGAEASLHPLFLACFRRLGVLPSEGIGCRPFDLHREGFLVSEAAAAVCIESGETSRALTVIDRMAMGGDAATITSSDSSGATLKHLIGRVIEGRNIDLFHVHGTGTIANDPVELAAIDSLSSADHRPVIFSHKGALGHSLGASGLLSVVLNLQMHRLGVVPANVRTESPLPSENMLLRNARIDRPIRNSVCIAAGFGGPVGVVDMISA